jgi:hypothetical protein
MSEFRIFCIGLLVWMGVIAAVLNRVDSGLEKGSVEGTLALLAMGLVGGAVAVALFGRRSQG